MPSKLKLNLVYTGIAFSFFFSNSTFAASSVYKDCEDFKIPNNPAFLLKEFDSKENNELSNTALKKNLNERLRDEEKQGDFSSRYKSLLKNQLKTCTSDKDIIASMRRANGALKGLEIYVNEIHFAPGPNGAHLDESVKTYSLINSALREFNGNVPADYSIESQGINWPVGQWIQDLDHSLEAIPNTSGLVFRGAMMTSEEFQSIQNSSENNPHIVPYFLSTSVSLVDATQFIYLRIKEQKWKGLGLDRFPVLLILKIKNGKSVSIGTSFEKEEEMLMPRNTKFKFKKVIDGGPFGLGSQTANRIDRSILKEQNIKILFIEEIL